MKRTALVCSLILAMAVAVTAAAPGPQKGKTVPRDISGVMDGRFTFGATTTGDVEGTLSHLGLSQMYTEHAIDYETFEISGGEFTIVAANGDQIVGTYTASGILAGDWSHMDGTAHFTVTGGTGRFAGASGMFTAGFLEVFDDGYVSAGVTWNLVGTVRY